MGTILTAEETATIERVSKLSLDYTDASECYGGADARCSKTRVQVLNRLRTMLGCAKAAAQAAEGLRDIGTSQGVHARASRRGWADAAAMWRDREINLESWVQGYEQEAEVQHVQWT